jgi:hypothetical protein
MPSYAPAKPTKPRLRLAPQPLNPAWLFGASQAVKHLLLLPESPDRNAAITHLKLIRPGTTNRDAKHHRDTAMGHVMRSLGLKIG